MLLFVWGQNLKALKNLAKITWRKPIQTLIDALNTYENIVKVQSCGGVIMITFPNKDHEDIQYYNFVKNQQLAEQIFGK